MRLIALALLSLSLVLVGCGRSLEDNEEVKSSDIKVASASENEEAVGVSEAPTERTVDLKGNYPWQYYFAEDIEKLQNQGETVYLFSDAEKLESDLIAFAYAEYEGLDQINQTKEDIADGWVKHVELFIKEVSAHVPDKTDYFAKMNEVLDALKSYNYESIPNLIDEAKTLR